MLSTASIKLNTITKPNEMLGKVSINDIMQATYNNPTKHNKKIVIISISFTTKAKKNIKK